VGKDSTGKDTSGTGFIGGLGGSLRRVRAIGRNTFREALRNRAFVALGISGGALLLFSLALGELAVTGQSGRVVVDFGFFAISLLAAVTAIVMGALLLHKEVDKKTIYTILSKPVRRFEFVLGKYAGMVSIVWLEIAVLGGVWALVLVLEGGGFGVEHVKGLGLMGLEAAVVTAVAVMFSAVSSPAVTALLSTGFFLVARLVPTIAHMLELKRSIFTEHEWLRPLGEGVVTALPDLGVFNVDQNVLLGFPTTWSYMAQATVYAGAYVAVLLALGIFAFERRDFV